MRFLRRKGNPERQKALAAILLKLEESVIDWFIIHKEMLHVFFTHKSH